ASYILSRKSGASGTTSSVRERPAALGSTGLATRPAAKAAPSPVRSSPRGDRPAPLAAEFARERSARPFPDRPWRRGCLLAMTGASLAVVKIAQFVRGPQPRGPDASRVRATKG